MNVILLKKMLEKRKQELKKIIAGRERSLGNAPDGSLRINKKDNRTDYYHYDSNNTLTPTHGRYIGRKNMELAAALAQKAYDKDVLKSANQELALIVKLAENYKMDYAEQVYGRLEIPRKTLVNPVFLSNSEFIKQWEAKEYEGKGFALGTPEIYTKKGERVRSKSEKIIADNLYSMGIPYKYECPLFLEPLGIIYPDFTILNMNTREEGYLEHFGILDDPEYLDNALKKTDLYIKNGIRPGKELIITYESSKHIFDERLLTELLRDYIVSE